MADVFVNAPAGRNPIANASSAVTTESPSEPRVAAPGGRSTWGAGEGSMNYPSKPLSSYPVRSYANEMSGHAEKAVERYLELSGLTEADLKPFVTPCIDDHAIPAEKFTKKG